MTHELHGFWQLVENVSFSANVISVLPGTCERFLESRFFLQQIIQLPVSGEYLNQANWLFSAHLAAVIGIWDAAKHDFGQANKSTLFGASEIGKEFFLSSTAKDPLERDPLALNRAYRDLRNLRVHYAFSIVRQDQNAIASITLGKDLPAPSNWFFNPIDSSRQKLLSKPHLSASELENFNEYISCQVSGHRELFYFGKVPRHRELFCGFGN